MRILIVNGYSQTQNGDHQFLAYINTIKQVNILFQLSFLQQMFLGARELLDTESEFYVRTAENLEDFLFEGEEFSKKESGIAFDYIDFVFIEIESNVRPWSAFSKKMVTLIRMCLRANKILFASSAAMLVVVFLIATNFESPITIINGINGGPIGDLSKVKKNLKKVKKNEFFLDNVTGDIYGIHISPDEEITWQPIGNAGIHYRKAAEEFKKIGQYMIKAPIYRPKTTLSQAIYKSTNEEEICYIRKSFLQDWFIKGLPAEFIINSANSWDIHSFNFVNPLKTFVTLAETQRGPAIIKVSESIFAVQFCIHNKSECAQTVLKNFINYQLTRIRALKVKSTKINLANEQVRQKKMAMNALSLDNNKNINTKKTQAANIKFQILAKFHHVGYAAKKKSQFEFVINNAIGQSKGQKGQSPQKSSPNSIKKSASNQNIVKKSNLIQNNNFVESMDSFEKKYFPNQQFFFLSFYDQEHEEQQQVIELERWHPFRKTQTEIRQMLHPKIKDEAIPPNQELWVPGNMTAALPETQQQRPITAKTRYTSSKMSLANTETYQTSISRPFSSSLKYQRSSFDVPLRNGQPYISNEEIERKQQLEKDKLIIGPKFIKTKSDGPKFLKNSLYTSPYNPPSSYKFRIEDKNKWVDGQDFIAC